MNNPVRWLGAELERWVAEGVVTPEQAARIRARYAVPPPAAEPRSWGLLLFSGLGAVVIGLGVILLLAYNWSDLPKAVKLALVFGGVAGAHVAGLRLRAAADWRPRLGEALSLLGTMLFGAGIWLVAQVYHIDEHFPNGFLYWGLGALALAWALGSVPQALLAAVVLTGWGLAEALGFRVPQEAAPLVLVVGVAPLAWRWRSPALTAALLAGLFVLATVHGAFRGGGGGAVVTFLAIAALAVALGQLTRGTDRFAIGSAVLRVGGWAGFLVAAYVLSFEAAANDLLRWRAAPAGAQALAAWGWRWGPVVVALAAWLAVLVQASRQRGAAVPREAWLLPLALLYAQVVIALGVSRDVREASALLFNVVLLGLAAMTMVRGCRDGRTSAAVGGSLLLSIVLLARFFDLFDSLAARGAAFLVLGGILFAEGFYYRRLRRSALAGEVRR